MSDVLYNATKYMNAEDALLAQDEKPKKREKQEDACKIGGGRWLGSETDERTGTQNPPLGGSQASPR